MTKYIIVARILRLLPPAVPIPTFLLESLQVQFRVETRLNDATAILYCYGSIHAQEALALADAVVPLLLRQTTIILNLGGSNELTLEGWARLCFCIITCAALSAVSGYAISPPVSRM